MRFPSCSIRDRWSSASLQPEWICGASTAGGSFVSEPTGCIPAGRERRSRAWRPHPVVHVAFGDAVAFAAWEGKSLPTEAEWEFAARGGLDGAKFAWGDQEMPNGQPMANFWQGEFPHENTLIDGWEGTSPVGMYPPNGYGIHDMIGNVWEWTDDWYRPRHQAGNPAKACCIPRNPRGGAMAESLDPRHPR